MNELIARYIEDRTSLTEAELQQLALHMEAHPDAIGEMRTQLACDELLSRRFDERRAVFVALVKQATASSGRFSIVPREGFVDSVERRVESAPQGARAWLAWAAAMVVLAASAAYLLPHTPMPSLTNVRGAVSIWRAQETLRATEGFTLKAGDWLLTSADGAAEVHFPGEMTTLKVGANAEFGMVAVKPGKELKLTTGTMTASVARQSASQPMLLRTPTARAEVLGTKFELSASKAATQLRVTEGRVLIAQKDEETGVVVETAQTATVTDSPTVEISTLSIGDQLQAGLLAHWTFDGPGGTRDASGNGHDLQVGAGAVWSEGRLGQALDLHAGKVDVETPRLDLPPVFTLAIWVRLELGEARAQPLLGYDGHRAVRDDFWLSIPPTLPGSSIVLEVRGREMGSRAFTKRSVVFAGRWQHLAIIADSAQGRAAFYVDGREVTAQAGLRRDFQLTGPLLIGRRTKGGPQPFDGKLDDLRLYARALTPAEIAALSEGKVEPK